MLVLMVDIVKPLGARFDNSFQSLKNKIFNTDADSPFYIKMPKGLKYEESATTKMLEKEIEEKTWINMTLAHDPTKKFLYEIRPLKLLNYEGFWYLLGVNCYEKLKKFRLDRILEAENTAKPFKIAKNFQKVSDQSTNI
jgi:predicted DNA-binding transcriptional regulator YafY